MGWVFIFGGAWNFLFCFKWGHSAYPIAFCWWLISENWLETFIVLFASKCWQHSFSAIWIYHVGLGVFWAIFSLALILHNLQEERTFYKPMKQSPSFYFLFQVFRQPITLPYISFGKIWILAETGCKTASYKYHIATTKRNGEGYICNIKSKNKFSLDRFPSKVDEFARRCSIFSLLISVL